jgi:hypothetical protein
LESVDKILVVCCYTLALQLVWVHFRKLLLAHRDIPVLEHLGIALFEPFGSFETVLEVALVGNFVLELVDSFVWEPVDNLV